MSNNIHWCSICKENKIRQRATEIHHIIFRSECRELIHCKLNMIYLCRFHHRDKEQEVHYNDTLNMYLKLQFQNKLEFLFNKRYFELEEIKEILGINKNAARKICEHLRHYKKGYKRIDIIRYCMGDHIITLNEFVYISTSQSNVWQYYEDIFSEFTIGA